MWGMPPPSKQLPDTTASLLHSERGAHSTTTCLWSAATSTATPSIDLATSHKLSKYIACVAVHGWGNLVFEMCGGAECFDYSCLPSTTIQDVPRTMRTHAKSSKPPVNQQDASIRQTCIGVSGRSEGGSPAGQKAEIQLQTHRWP
jgi:hypothetical protein